MATNYNQFKDTTVYGNFNNSNKASPSLTAEATFDGTITGKNNIYCNGDLYVGKITETTDPMTGIVSNVITGGEIYSKGNNINTLYQSKEISTDPYLTSSIASTTYQVKGNYLTSASLVSPTFSGTPKSTTPATGDNTTNIATTAYVKSNLTLYALLASPTFSGTPKSTTPATTDNTTNIATTAYVKSNLSSYVTNSTLGTTIGPYLTSATALNLYLQIATASTTYQPKGNYLTTASLDNYITSTSLSTSLNSYLTTATAGDLYLLKVSNWVSSTALTTQLANYLSLTNASATYQPKGNYLTTASFDNYLPLSGGTMNGALTTTILNIKGQTIDGQISCMANTDGIFYKSGQNHMFNVDNGTVSVFAIETSGVNTTKPIKSFSTINAVEGLQENSVNISSIYQTKSFTATIKCLSYVYSKYVNQSINSTLYGFWFYDNNGFYLEPKTDRNIVVNNALYFISSWGDSTVQLTQNEIPYLINQGLQIRFANPSNKKYTVLLNGIHRSDNQTTNQGLFFQINQKTNITLNGVNHSSFYIRWSYNHLNTFLDTQTTDSLTEEFVRTGLFTVPGSNPGNIDLCVTLI